MKKLPLWSATPTPLQADLSPDLRSVERLVDHHAALGMDGIMLGGTCGEGPWLPSDHLCAVVERAVAHSAGRLQVVVQVTDNSVARMLGASERVASLGADLVLVAAPYFMMNPTADRIFEFYREMLDRSPLPVVYYDRGGGDRYRLTVEQLKEVGAHPRLAMIKNSALDPERTAAMVAVKRQRSDLLLLTGSEFDLADELRAGSDGGMLGGAIFNAPLAIALQDCWQRERLAEADALQVEMNALMHCVYGGPEIKAWLTGLKYFLVKLGLFTDVASTLGYPLDEEVREAIDALFDGPRRERWVEPLLTHRTLAP